MPATDMLWGPRPKYWPLYLPWPPAGGFPTSPAQGPTVEPGMGGRAVPTVPPKGPTVPTGGGGVGIQPGVDGNPRSVEPTVNPAATGGGGTTGTEGGTATPGNATDAILKDFTNALGNFLGRGNFGGNIASWMRQNQDMLGQQFLENYMRTQEGNTVSTFSPQDFFSTYNPFLSFYMSRPETRGSYRLPAVTTRRLRV